MSSATRQPSSRFVRAAIAERDELVRHRQRLGTERDGVLDELRRLDEALGDVDQRVAILEQLIGPAAHLERPVTPARPTGNLESVDGEPAGGDLIRGPAIRAAAVKVLLDQHEYIEALHYRRWYELTREAGYVISGKDPLAVFLTQITRSPVVRKTDQAGVYELDRQAPLRLRQRLERLEGELRELLTVSAADTPTTRARRHELDVAISQQERALEEALAVLRRDEVGEPRLSARSAS
jgi:hypothetical protein